MIFFSNWETINLIVELKLNQFSLQDVFRQMVYKAPGSISMGRLAGQSNMREEVQKFREFLQTRRPQPSDWVKFKPPTTTTTSTTTGTTAPPNLSECFIEIQEVSWPFQ